MKLGDKKKRGASGNATRYLAKKRKDVLARIFILQDLVAEYRISIPRHTTLEFELNFICFDGPIHDLMHELRLIDGKKTL